MLIRITVHAVCEHFGSKLQNFAKKINICVQNALRKSIKAADSIEGPGCVQTKQRLIIKVNLYDREKGGNSTLKL